MKAIMKNLEDQTNTNEPRIAMYCRRCGNIFSANKSDYFYISDPEYKFKCHGIMELVYRANVFIPA